MISAEALQMLEREKPYLVPEGKRYEDIEPAIHALILPYETEPWREYHDTSHLMHMSEYLLGLAYEMRNPRVVFLGKNAHDTFQQPWMYNTRLMTRGINESVSGLILRTLAAPFYTPEEVDLADEYVLATAGHNTDTTDPDLQKLLDADMRILGEDEPAFDAYDEGVMAEFLYNRPELRRLYQMGRFEFLTRLDERRIFCSEQAQDLYENKAHANIKRTLARYSLELARVPA